MIKNRLRLSLRLRLSRLSSIFFLTLALICLLAVALAEAQAPVQISPQTLEIPVETVKPVINVEVENGIMGVEISDAEFGEVIKEIAGKAKFKVEIASDVASKKISTNFKGVDIERGIRRLLTIIKEKDYTISYNSEGFIDKLEIYGGGNSKPAVSPPPKKPQVTQRPVLSPATPTPLPSQKPQPKVLPPPRPPQPEIPIEENN